MNPARSCPRQPKLIIAACAGVAILSVWLRMGVPVFAIGWARHDDALFVRLAYYLGAGRWLGPYDQLTLAKGMAYPAFIVAAFGTGIPLKIAEHILYLVACAFSAWLVDRQSRSHWLSAALFVCLAFNPILWSPELARVIREGLYISLSLAVFTGVAALLLARDTLSLAKPRVFLLGTVLGFLLAAFWLTREEGVWLLPALAFLALVAAVDAWLSRGVPGVAVVLWLGAIPVITFGSTLVAVAGLNYWHYGAFTLNEVQSGPFRAAYGALSRIKSDTSSRFIVFPKEAREAAYSVSGAALELRPTLDGEVGENWRKIGCEQMRLDQCRDIPAGWFMWALRDAVAAAGHYTSAADALAYYDRLAGEINRACDDGQLSCLSERASLVAPFKWTYVRDAVEKMPALVGILLHFSEVGSFPSVGPRVMLDRFTDLVGPLAGTAAPSVVLLLRGKGSAKLPSLLVRDRNGGPVEWKIAAVPRNERAADAGVRTVDLELETDCVRASCELVITAGAEEQAFAIQSLKMNQFIVPNLELSAIGSGLISAGELRRHMQLRVLREILFVYRQVVPVLAVGAGFGLLLALVLRRRVSLPLQIVWLAIACAIAVGARVAMLAYIDVTAFPAANALYLSPALPFFLMLIVLGTYVGIVTTTAWCRGKWRVDYAE